MSEPVSNTAPAPAPAPAGDAPGSTSDQPIRRLRISTNVALQVVIGLLLFGIANYLGYRHFKQWDYTIDRHFTLADSTKKYLSGVKANLRITVLTVRGDTVEKDITPLLDQYRKELNNQLEIEYVDTRRDVPAWERLKMHLKEIGMEIPGNGLLVEQISAPNEKGARQLRARFVPESGLYVTQKDAGGQVTRKAFRGETMLNAAIRLVSENELQKIGVISDMGRPRKTAPDAPSVLNKLTEIGNAQNFTWEPVPMFESNDGALLAYKSLVWIAPDDFSPSGSEEARLTQYIESPGRGLLIMFDPQKPTPKLSAWLAKYGIERQNDRIIYTIETAGGLEPRTDLQVRCMDGAQITQGLENQQVQLHLLSCSLKMNPDGEKQRAENIEIKPLLSVNETYWGETSPLSEPPVFDKAKDNAPPLYAAVSAERGATPNAAKRGITSRFVAIGNSTFADPDGIGFASNYDFMVRTLNWLLHRDALTTNDSGTDKLKERFSLELKSSQRLRLIVICCGVLPLLVLGAGLLIWQSRRS